MNRIRNRWPIATLVALSATWAMATTVAPPQNLGELAKMSGAVVLAKAGGSHNDSSRWLPRTVTSFELVEHVAGLKVPATFEVAEPGGSRGDGTAVAIAGVPDFVPGRDYLLFLGQGPNGRWRSVTMAYGTLESTVIDGFDVLRPVKEAQDISLIRSSHAEPIGTYFLSNLVSELRAVVAGETEWSAGRSSVPESMAIDVEAAAAPPNCDFMSYSGNNIRWFSFDSGGTYTIRPTTPDQSGSVDGAAAVSAAAATWRGHSASKMGIYSGSTISENINCTSDPDDGQMGAVVFNDPCNDIDPLSGGCAGTLGFGGPSFSLSAQTFDGDDWWPAQQAFIVVNDGSECLGQSNFNEMITHELGHGMGFGHHTDSGATMYFQCCRGGGAALYFTDESCASYLYPEDIPVPNAPSGLSATTFSDTRIDLSWNDNSSDEDGFEIWRRTGGGSFVEIDTVGQNVESYNDTGLDPCTTYTYRVDAYNGGGSSSSGTDGDTTTGSAPAQITGLSATAVSSSQINLSWTNGGTAQSLVRIQRKIGAGSFSNLTTVSGSSTSYSNSGLDDNTLYTYRVRGENDCGDGSWSNEASDTTPEATVPDAPSNLSATAISSTQVSLTWDDNSSDESGFKVFRQIGGSWTQIATLGANSESYTDPGRTPCVALIYWVKAYNGNGDSDSSNTDSVTPGDVPSAPTNLVASPVSSNRIDLSWSNGAGSQDSILIQRATGAGPFLTRATVSGSSTSYSDTAVAPETTYSYRVRASNGCGDGPFSNEDDATTPAVGADPPNAPSNMNATAVSSSQINLTWNDNSADEIGFRIYRSLGSGFTLWREVGANVTSTSNTGLATCTTATYYATAYNGDGESPASNTDSATTGGSAPAAPSNVNAVATSETRVELSWTNASGSPTGIEIQRAIGSGGFAALATVGGSSTSYQDNAVSAGTTYHYRLRTLSDCGTSGWSATKTVTTPSGGGSYAPSFSWSPTQPRLGQTVSFSGSSPGSPSVWAWNFGDGDNGSGQEVTHIYTDTGTFNVRLTVSGSAGSANVTLTVTILPALDPIVAASANKRGKSGTYWTTNIAITNAGPTRTEGDIRFIQGSGPTNAKIPFSVNARNMFVVENVVDEMGVNATGGLIVELDEDRAAPLIMSRTFTPGPAGTYGHSTPGQGPLGSGTYYLTGVRGGPDYRTNFGIAVSRSGGASVQLTLRLPTGTLPGPTLQMPAGSMAQWGIEDLWGSPVLSGVTAATLEVVLTGEAVIYIATVDEKSGDPVYITGGTPSTRWQIPLIGRSPGKFQTFWDTDVIVYNPHSFSATVELEWLPADLDNRSGTMKTQIILAPRETRLIQNTPKTLWSVEQGNGSVMIIATRSIVIEARTWTPVPNGLPGTMGQRIIPIDLSGTRPVPSALPWVREDAEVRTNVGFVNRSNHVIELELRLYKSTGSQARTGAILLAPRSVSQRSLEFLFGNNPLGSGNSGWVEIRGGATSDHEIFCSQVVNDSGDPIFILGS